MHSKATPLAVVAFVVVASLGAVTTSAAPSPPTVPLPYTTTMLRTHHYRAAEFLSIAEKLSVRQFEDDTGRVTLTQKAYYITTGLPFSMRDPNNTMVLGIRAVFETNTTDPANPTSVVYYYVTDLDSNERCLRHSVSPLPPPLPPSATTYLGTATFRGISNCVGWRTVDPSSLLNTTTYYYPETRGSSKALYEFHIELIYPPGGAEIGYVLNQGTHFPAEGPAAWFDTTSTPCPPAASSHQDQALHQRALGGHPEALPDPWVLAPHFAKALHA